MAHRTQITLSDQQYELLKRESQRTGLSLAELVRRALDDTFLSRSPDLDLALERSFGAWTDQSDGEDYVERLRRPGLGRRLAT